MNKQQNIFKNNLDIHIDYDIIKSSLENFAKLIDDKIQNELLTRLVLDHSAIARQLELLNKELKKTQEELKKYSHHLEELVEEKVKEISESQMSTIYALIKLSESRDDDTGIHIERTASFCRLLAEKAMIAPRFSNEIDDKFLDTIYKASPLHDIGKVGIPDRILLKPGKLTYEEFETMKTHVQIGFQTIAEVEQKYSQNDFLKMGMDIALYHHEKWDGSGYLHGLKKEEIPLSARIMAIADVYDALRSKRVYKEAYLHEKSMEMIISRGGSHFDPGLINVLSENQDHFEKLYKSMI